MQDQWDGTEDEGTEDDTESAAGDVKPMSRLAVVGARASLLLGLAAVGVMPFVPWPSVSRQ